jgi:hypothetical protein
MSTAFREKEYRAQTFFQRLFKVLPTENAIIELNNLLSQKEAASICVDDVKQIASKYKVDIYKNYHNDFLSFYSDYLAYCLKDKKLSEDEIKALDNLKYIFFLNDNDTKKIHHEAAGKIYKREVHKAVEDGKLDAEEEKFLLDLEKKLQLPHDLAMSIYGENAQELLVKTVKGIIADEKLSPDEEKQIQALSENLHIKLTLDDATKALLDKYKLFWQIDNGILPVDDSGINLAKSEVCHFSKNSVIWNEQRAVTRRVSYSGLSYRVNICKGLSWRIGDISPEIISEDVWKVIDAGSLYLTNKRIIFMGTKGNKTIPFKKILDFTVHTNGIDIQKDTGKSPFLEFDTAADVFGMILGKLLMSE